ncbi:translation initiation factor IF-2 [Clostridia bacterium]|nr:translation initiation factor IF-2 [Clostridia bacterium]
MGKKRLYELAKELKTTNQEMLWVVNKLGIEAKNHMSTLAPDDEKKVRAFIAEAFKRLEQKENERKRAVKERKDAEKREAARREAEEKKKSEDATKRKPAARPATDRRPQPRQDRSRDSRPPRKADIPDEKPAFEIKPSKKLKQAPPKKKIYNSDEERRQKKIKKEKIDRNLSLSERRSYQKTRKKKSKGPKQPPALITEVTIGEEITIKDLAMKIRKTAGEVISKLMKLGVMATINESIDFDTAVLVLDEFKIKAEFKTNKRVTEIEITEVDDAKDLKRRPPIITVMGHVDHGKTSLLDAIRATKVTEGEAGGITQHIGAYQVEKNGEKMTFIDTPGHAAFTSMRARGAQITDIAILVVAADDGVMPQTIEAIAHSKAAGVPIIVAVNKMDKEGANPDRVMQQLTEYELVPEDWGGDTIFCKVSAVTKEGLDNLLEMILLVSEILELKANPERHADGFVIEAELDKGRGPVATLLVKQGTLNVGDVVVTGQCVGKVRAMNDESGESITTAPPATPVEVLGLSSVPKAGDIFQSVDNEKYARDIVEQRCIVEKEETVSKSRKVTLEDLFKNFEEGQKKELSLIIKGDVQGSVEALSQSLLNLNTDEVKVGIIHSGVGAITETDVILASASNAIIIGFNVRPDSNAKKVAAQEEVDIKLYRIIYEAIDDVRAAMSGLLEPEIREVELGVAEVRNTFKVPKAGTIAGCYVTSGKITNSANVRIVRGGVIVFDGKLSSLKRFKDDAKEVASGFECGIGFEKFNDMKEGDIIEAYTFEKIAREL